MIKYLTICLSKKKNILFCLKFQCVCELKKIALELGNIRIFISEIRSKFC